MASNFNIVHHEFKAGRSSKWWDAAYSAMSSRGVYDYSIMANKEKCF